MYLRKSSESEDRQQLSLDAQEDALRRIVADRGLQLVGEPIREAKSAKRPGRPLFEKMMVDISAGRANGILCWHLDRLARNPVDGGRVIWALDLEEITEIATPTTSFFGNPDDKMMMHIHFGMAMKYVGDLSRNIKRGNEAALKVGRWPSIPKLGYLREPKTRELYPDPDRFHRVRKLWELRLEGVPILEILRTARCDMKLTTPLRGKSGTRHGGALLSSAQLYRLLQDPFYAGVMVRQGETYTGNHPPMVSWAEFQRVQDSFRTYRDIPARVDTRRQFTYRGLLRCGSCAATVTAEFQRQRHGHEYTYYHCCNKRRNYNYCPEPSIEERVLETQLGDWLQTLYVPPKVETALLKALENEAKKVSTYHGAEVERVNRRIAEIDTMLDNLRGMCARQVITEAEFDRDRKSLNMERLNLGDIAARPMDSESLLEPAKRKIYLATEAFSEFQAGDSARKREVLRGLIQNLELSAKNVKIEPKPVFAALAALPKVPAECRVRRIARTLLQS